MENFCNMFKNQLRNFFFLKFQFRCAKKVAIFKMKRHLRNSTIPFFSLLRYLEMFEQSCKSKRKIIWVNNALFLLSIYLIVISYTLDQKSESEYLLVIVSFRVECVFKIVQHHLLMLNYTRTKNEEDFFLLCKKKFKIHLANDSKVFYYLDTTSSSVLHSSNFPNGKCKRDPT